MCTLSIIRLSDQLVITMNRDEARSRHESGLKEQKKAGVELLYPIDGQAGGTWFGVNNQGVVLALLNRYQDPQSSCAPTRGNIIAQALAYGKFELVKKHLSEQGYQHYNPFDLLLISLEECLHFRWNGQQLVICNVSENAQLFSSSAVNTQSVLAKRQLFFKEEISQIVELSAINILQQIHLQHDLNSQANSVLMDRSDAHSKSICQVLLDQNCCEFNYYPEGSLQQWRAVLNDAKPLLNAQLNKEQRIIALKNESK